MHIPISRHRARPDEQVARTVNRLPSPFLAFVVSETTSKKSLQLFATRFFTASPRHFVEEVPAHWIVLCSLSRLRCERNATNGTATITLAAAGRAAAAHLAAKARATIYPYLLNYVMAEVDCVFEHNSP